MPCRLWCCLRPNDVRLERWAFMCTSNVNKEYFGNKALRCSYNIFVTSSAFGGSDDNKQYDDDDDNTKGGRGLVAIIIRDFQYTRYFRYLTTPKYKDFTVYSIIVVVVVVFVVVVIVVVVVCVVIVFVVVVFVVVVFVVVVVVCGLSMSAVVIISLSAQAKFHTVLLTVIIIYFKLWFLAPRKKFSMLN